MNWEKKGKALISTPGKRTQNHGRERRGRGIHASRVILKKKERVKTSDGN